MIDDSHLYNINTSIGNYVVKTCSQKFDLCMKFTTLLIAFLRVWAYAHAMARLSWNGLVIILWTDDIQCASSLRVIYNSFPSSCWLCFSFVNHNQSCQRKSIRSSLFSEFHRIFFHCFDITCSLLITFILIVPYADRRSLSIDLMEFSK